MQEGKGQGGCFATRKLLGWLLWAVGGDAGAWREWGGGEDGDVRTVWGRLQRSRSQCEGPTVRDTMRTLFWRSKPFVQ